MKRNSFYNFFNKDNSKNNDGKLPSNRFKAYFDFFKNRFSKLILLSLITCLFFLPLVIFTFLWGVYMNYAKEQFLTTNPDEKMILFQNFSLICLQYLFSIPLFILSFIGLGGTFSVAKKMVFQEGDLFLWSDFFNGVKSNIKSSLLSGVVFSIYTFIYFMNIYFYPIVDEIPFFLKVILIILLSIIFVIVASFSLFVLCGASIYKFKFIATTKNNLLLSVILLPSNLLMVIVSMLFIIGTFFIPLLIMQFIFLALLVFYGFSHLAISFSLYAYHVFDKHINSKYSLELIDKGLDKSKGE